MRRPPTLHPLVMVSIQKEVGGSHENFWHFSSSKKGQLAQSEERGANNATVAGSIPALTNVFFCFFFLFFFYSCT